MNSKKDFDSNNIDSNIIKVVYKELLIQQVKFSKVTADKEILIQIIARGK